MDVVQQLEQGAHVVLDVCNLSCCDARVFSLGHEINNRVDVEEEVYRAIEFTLEEFHLHRDVDALMFKFEMERDKERRRGRENGEDKNTWRIVAWLVSGVVLKVALETVYQDGKKRLFG